MMKEAIFIFDRKIESSELIETIRKSGDIPRLIREIIIERATQDIELDKEEEFQIFNKFKEEKELESEENMNKFLEGRMITHEMLKNMVTRPVKVVKFREERWGPVARSIYLKKKEQYDLVTYKYLQCQSAGRMQDVYYRLKDKESSWEQMAKQLNGNESSYRIGPLPIRRVEEVLLAELRTSKRNTITKPIKIGVNYVVAELVAFEPTRFDDKMRDHILREEFDEWLRKESIRAFENLRFE